MSRNRGRAGTPTVGTTTQDVSPPPNLIPETTPEPGTATFSFVVPTEFVELPSQGHYYTEGHPLHNCDTVEIRQMTAKEEDMLTSRSLLKKGIAVDRVIQSLIVDTRLSADSLLIGDKNAIVIAARCSGYGNIYETKVTCPECSTTQPYEFDLNEAQVKHGTAAEALGAHNNGDGTFNLKLPVTEVTVTFRLLTGADERAYLNSMNRQKTKRKSKSQLDTVVTSQLRNLITAVNGDSSPDAVNYLVDNIPSRDSRRIRSAYKLASPDINLDQHFECVNCDYSDEMEVPLTADFFWPDR